MPFKDHFSTVSDSYAKYRPTYPDELYQFILKHVEDRDHAWDCATGNGQAAVVLANYFNRVTATDASAAQIEKASEHPKVNYQIASAENSGLPENSIDLITVAQAMHWFDFDKFFREVRRVGRVNSKIAVWTYGLVKFDDDSIDSLITNFYEAKVGQYWPPERSFIQEEYRTILFPFDEFEAPEFHVEINHNLDSLINYFSTWSAVKYFIRENGYSPLDELKDKLKEVWGNSETILKSRTPIYLRLGKVH
ncbi:MAG: class I SAM-dependent methyltransferase [Cyclobacteriaceae bacterium]